MFSTYEAITMCLWRAYHVNQMQLIYFLKVPHYFLIKHGDSANNWCTRNLFTARESRDFLSKIVYVIYYLAIQSSSSSEIDVNM